MTDERSAPEVAVDGTQPAAGAGFGARLAAEREQRALSQADVARALNLRVAVIVAIEEEDFSNLPKMAFVRGYARTYARLLDVAEAEIAEALRSWRDPEEDGRLPLSPGSVVSKRGLGRGLHGHAGLILTLLSILVAVVLAAVLLAIWPEGGFTGSRSEPAVEAPASSPDNRVAPAALLDSVPSSVPDAADGEADAELGQDDFADDGYDGSEAAEEAAQLPRRQARQESAAQAPAAAMTAAVATEVAAAVPVANAGPGAAAGFSVRRESADDGRVLRVFAEGEDLVELRFGGDCWVEIRDAEGRGVVSDLAREGQTLEVHGQGPFRVLLGYAHGVQIAYNGERVALAPHIRNDIASLVVGR